VSPGGVGVGWAVGSGGSGGGWAGGVGGLLVVFVAVALCAAFRLLLSAAGFRPVLFVCLAERPG